MLHAGVCVGIPFILDVRVADVPTGITQEEGHTGFLIHLPSAVLVLNFLARRIQPFLSLVDGEVEFRVLLIERFHRSLLVGHFIHFLHFFLVRKNPSSCDDTEIRSHIPTSEGFEVPT